MASVSNNAELAITKFKAGNLRNCHGFWRKLTSDDVILRLASGIHIDFVSETKMVIDAQPYMLDSAKSNKKDDEILALLSKGVIERCQVELGQVEARIFIKEQKDGSLRVIHDLSKLNDHIKYEHFKMQSIEAALNLVTEGCYMASADLKDAYHYVPVRREFKKFSRFCWRDQLYQLRKMDSHQLLGC